MPQSTKPAATQNLIIGQNIKALRERLQLTQESLAAYLGIAREQVAYFEAGTRTVSTDQLSKLANIFCIDEYDFFEPDAQKRNVNFSFAFRADSLESRDLESMARFKKIIRNYMNMKSRLHE